MKFPSREFDDAVAALCQGAIGDEQLAALHELLQADAAARDEYLWQVELHSRLASMVVAEHSNAAISAVPQKRAPMAWVAAGALVVVTLAVGYLALTHDHVSGIQNDGLTQDVERGDGTHDGSPHTSAASGALAGIPRQNVRFAFASDAPVIVGTGRREPIRLGESVPYGENGNWLHVWNWSQAPVSRVYEIGLHEEQRFALSPDGRWLVWSKGDVLDLETEERTTIDLGGANHFSRGQDELLRRIQDMQFSPDGGRLALLISELDMKLSTHPLRHFELDKSMMIQIVEFPSAQLLCEFPADKTMSLRIGFSFDGERVVSKRPESPQIDERDVASGEVLRSHEVEGYPYAIGVSPDGNWTAACDDEAGLLVWSTATGELVHRVDDALIWSGSTVVRFSPDNRYVAFEGRQHVELVIQVVDVQTGEIVSTLPQWSVADIHWSPDSQTLTAITGHMYDGRFVPLYNIYPAVDVWDWRARKRVQSFATSP
jgi:dipeptidyl aminopeptidase/acylaminoacyl peptidase